MTGSPASADRPADETDRDEGDKVIPAMLIKAFG